VQLLASTSLGNTLSIFAGSGCTAWQ
jgi:hypothetical protein